MFNYDNAHNIICESVENGNISKEDGMIYNEAAYYMYLMESVQPVNIVKASIAACALLGSLTAIIVNIVKKAKTKEGYDINPECKEIKEEIKTLQTNIKKTKKELDKAKKALDSQISDYNAAARLCGQRTIVTYDYINPSNNDSYWQQKMTTNTNFDPKKAEEYKKEAQKMREASEEYKTVLKELKLQLTEVKVLNKKIDKLVRNDIVEEDKRQVLIDMKEKIDKKYTDLLNQI